ncbi:unnamed protein product [Urochloa humidicola]
MPPSGFFTFLKHNAIIPALNGALLHGSREHQGPCRRDDVGREGLPHPCCYRLRGRGGRVRGRRRRPSFGFTFRLRWFHLQDL